MIAWLLRRYFTAPESGNESGALAGGREVADPESSPEQVYHDAARHFLDAQISSLLCL
jgi:hypothetical protein